MKLPHLSLWAFTEVPLLVVTNIFSFLLLFTQFQFSNHLPSACKMNRKHIKASGCLLHCGDVFITQPLQWFDERVDPVGYLVHVKTNHQHRIFQLDWPKAVGLSHIIEHLLHSVFAQCWLSWSLCMLHYTEDLKFFCGNSPALVGLPELTGGATIAAEATAAGSMAEPMAS